MESVEKKQKGLTRRGFVKGTVAGSVAGMVLGTVAGVGAAVTSAPAVAKRKLTCDVLIVGWMGFAGLAATLRAAEQGVNVIAIDKQLSDSIWVGGNMPLSQHNVHICSQSLMLPPDVLLAKLAKDTENNYLPDVAQAHVTNAKRALTWFTDRGKVEWMESSGRERIIKPNLPSNYWVDVKPGGPSDFRNYGGYKAAKNLESAIKAKKNVTILYGTRAVKLLTDAQGKVSGILAEDKDRRFEIKAKGVILATGGYERNKELMSRWVGPHADEMEVYGWHTVGGHSSSTGDGHLMALEVGAAMRHLNYPGTCSAYSEASMRNENLLNLALNSLVSGIVVNKGGERFCDESLGFRVIGSLMVKTTVSVTGFFVIDQTIYETPAVKRTVDDLIKNGGPIHIADTIPALATKADINQYLATTIDEFNKAVDDGKIKEIRVPKTAAKVYKIATPPFYAVPFRIGTVATYGGLHVSPKGEVMCVFDNKPIPGLYAAGVLMEGSLTGGAENAAGAYVGCLSSCLIFGILSAENAAEYAKNRRI
jgi:succinate dehydrogenase/fumarate reductase flavoprotein subunit